MTDPQKDFNKFLREEVEKNDGVLFPVKASFLERILVSSVPAGKIHPNPDDEFCWPQVGPSQDIISRYARIFQKYRKMMPKAPEYAGEALMVEKVHPDGYMLLNGHHRWAAGLKAGIRNMPVKIVNLTQETDIQQMIAASVHDKRVTMDLDEAVFCRDENTPCEKPFGFPRNRVFKERIQLGIPALLNFLSKQGYDIWVFTAGYYSTDYIQAYFKRYAVKVDGVVTGTARKTKQTAESRKHVETLFSHKYRETLHIDRENVLRSFRDSKDFEDYAIDAANAEGWSAAVIGIIKGLKQHEEDR